MEIGLKRLDIIRTSLSVIRDILNAPEGTCWGKVAAEVREAFSLLDIDIKEVTALHEDISCRIKTIKELETL